MIFGVTELAITGAHNVTIVPIGVYLLHAEVPDLKWDSDVKSVFKSTGIAYTLYNSGISRLRRAKYHEI